MLKIRLARVGKKNYATFRVIISDHTKSPKAEAMEILGSYDPNVEPAALKLNEERVKYWLSKGVGYSDTIRDLLAKKGLIKKVELIKCTSKHPKRPKSQIEKDKAAAAEKAKQAKAAPQAEAKSSEKAPEPKKEEKKEAPKAEAKKDVPKKEAPKPAVKKEAKQPEVKETSPKK